MDRLLEIIPLSIVKNTKNKDWLSEV